MAVPQVVRGTLCASTYGYHTAVTMVISQVVSSPQVLGRGSVSALVLPCFVRPNPRLMGCVCVCVDTCLWVPYVATAMFAMWSPAHVFWGGWVADSDHLWLCGDTCLRVPYSDGYGHVCHVVSCPRFFGRVSSRQWPLVIMWRYLPTGTIQRWLRPCSPCGLLPTFFGEGE